MLMNKIQALANEMKQFFSPQTVTNVYSICKKLKLWKLLYKLMHILNVKMEIVI